MSIISKWGKKRYDEQYRIQIWTSTILSLLLINVISSFVTYYFLRFGLWILVLDFLAVFGIGVYHSFSSQTKWRLLTVWIYFLLGIGFALALYF